MKKTNQTRVTLTLDNGTPLGRLAIAAATYLEKEGIDIGTEVSSVLDALKKTTRRRGKKICKRVGV